MSTSCNRCRFCNSLNDDFRGYGSINNDLRQNNAINDNLQNADRKDCWNVSNVIGVAIGKIIYYTVRSFGRLLCMGKMSQMGRVAVLWIWIMALALGSGLIVWRGLYLRQDISSSVADMRVVSKKGDTIFCTDTTVIASDVIDIYLLPKFPSVEKQRHEFDISQNATLNGDSFVYWGFYLIYGSTLYVTGNVIGDWVNFFVIKGDDNLEEWKKSELCSHCFLKEDTLPIGEPYEYTLNITGSDDYYILYSKTGSANAQLTADIYLNKTQYDTTSFMGRCIASEDCNFNLDLGSEQTVVIVVGEKQKTFELHVAVLCTARNWMYLVLFLVIPLLTGICASLLIYKIAKPLTKHHHNIPTIDENGRLIFNDRRYLIIEEDNMLADRQSTNCGEQDSFSGETDRLPSFEGTCSHLGLSSSDLMGEPTNFTTTRILTERISASDRPLPEHTVTDRTPDSTEAEDRHEPSQVTLIKQASLPHVTTGSGLPTQITNDPTTALLAENFNDPTAALLTDNINNSTKVLITENINAQTTPLLKENNEETAALLKENTNDPTTSLLTENI